MEISDVLLEHFLVDVDTGYSNMVTPRGLFSAALETDIAATSDVICHRLTFGLLNALQNAGATARYISRLKITSVEKAGDESLYEICTNAIVIQFFFD